MQRTEIHNSCIVYSSILMMEATSINLYQWCHVPNPALPVISVDLLLIQFRYSALPQPVKGRGVMKWRGSVILLHNY